MKALLFFLLFATSVSAQGISLVKGVVMDSIPVNDTLTSTYSLYLPTAFNGDTAMPAIFIFDGEGRGMSAARMFQKAAEEQGYILVSSNSVASGKGLKENLTSALILIQEVTKKIPIDFDYISMAGFADGAAIATSLPLILDNIHGVIYIGDHNFNSEHIKEKKSFLAVGLVGSKQGERYDMWSASQHLDYLREANQLYVFEGGKKWPKTTLIESAVGALTLEAMRTGKRLEDLRLITQLYSKDLIFANDLIDRNEFISTERFLEKLEEKYDGLISTREAENRLRLLKKSDGFKEQKLKFEIIWNKHSKWLVDLLYYFDNDVNNGNYSNLGWWNYQKVELEKLRKGAEQMEASMAGRLLYRMKQVTGDAVGKVEADSYSLDAKLMTNMIATIFDQQNFEAYENIIALSANDNDFSTALYYLEELLKNGFTDAGALYDIDGALGLKSSKEFNWLIKKYLGSSKYYNNATSLY